MNKFRIIKTISALLLAVSFFLPLSIMKCGPMVAVEAEPTIVGPDGETIENILPKQTIKPKDEPIDVDRYIVPYKGIDLHEPATLLLVITFMWPIPILFLVHFGRPAKVISVFKILEPIGCIGSGYIIVWTSFIFGDPLFAGYMATASIAGYFVVSCFDAGIIIRDFINRWRTRAFSGSRGPCAH